MLDPRTVIVFQDYNKIYIWIGSQCNVSYRDIYLANADILISRLQRYESGSKNVQQILEREEDEDFLQILKRNKQNISDVIRINKNWNDWFLNLEEDYKIRSARSYKSIMCYAERDDLKFKPAIFIYPYYSEPLYILDLDDLNDDTFALLCDKENKQVYVWQGENFNIAEKENNFSVQDFIDLSAKRFYELDDLSLLEFKFEIPKEETDDFYRYFTIL